jgi:hypothetical protein
MLLPSTASCSDGLKEHIFSAMANDDVALVARKDELIIAYGERLYQKHGHKKHKRSHIRQKLRQLARFVIAARKENSSVTDLCSCIDATKFPVVISAVRQLCGYQSLDNSFKNPSLALKLGHSLKQCAATLRSISLVEGNADQKERCTAFVDVVEDEWQNFISSAAVATLAGQKWNKPHVLPLTEDIRRVTTYLKEERSKGMAELKKNPTTTAWHALAKAVLANVILFNRRRSGEAARMLVSEYQSARSCPTAPKDDILECLSPMEKKLVDSFQRVEICGKRDRKVPVLLTNAMCDEIDQLIAVRHQVGIDENPYVFARPYYSSENHLAGHECLGLAAKESGAEQPANITSTKLRQHLATVSQVLNLTEHELEQVCGHMGHNIAVHREFYRLPDDTYQLAKVSRLLIALEQGQISRFQGKTLEEIEVDLDIPDSEVDEDNTHEKESTSDAVHDPEVGPVEMEETEVLQKTPDRLHKKRHRGQSKQFLTVAEKRVIQHHFREHIDNFKIPQKAECELAIKTEPLLAGKVWSKIKFTVRNEIEKRKREIKSLRRH